MNWSNAHGNIVVKRAWDKLVKRVKRARGGAHRAGVGVLGRAAASGSGGRARGGLERFEAAPRAVRRSARPQRGAGRGSRCGGVSPGGGLHCGPRENTSGLPHGRVIKFKAVTSNESMVNLVEFFQDNGLNRQRRHGEESITSAGAYGWTRREGQISLLNAKLCSLSLGTMERKMKNVRGGERKVECF